MPDILIRGMEKPGSCRDCDFCEVQDINFEILYYCNRNDRFLDDEEVCNIPSDCPIIELPPHGDLIDRDAFECISYKGTEGRADTFDDGVLWLLDQTDEIPVIVPAERN